MKEAGTTGLDGLLTVGSEGKGGISDEVSGLGGQGD